MKRYGVTNQRLAIGSFVVLACGFAVSDLCGQGPFHDRAPPACTVDGQCYPNRPTWGHYRTNWRRWPQAPAEQGPAETALPRTGLPEVAPPSPATEDRASAEKTPAIPLLPDGSASTTEQAGPGTATPGMDAGAAPNIPLPNNGAGNPSTPSLPPSIPPSPNTPGFQPGNTPSLPGSGARPNIPNTPMPTGPGPGRPNPGLRPTTPGGFPSSLQQTPDNPVDGWLDDDPPPPLPASLRVSQATGRVIKNNHVATRPSTLNSLPGSSAQGYAVRPASAVVPAAGGKHEIQRQSGSSDTIQNAVHYAPVMISDE